MAKRRQTIQRAARKKKAEQRARRKAKEEEAKKLSSDVKPVPKRTRARSPRG